MASKRLRELGGLAVADPALLVLDGAGVALPEVSGKPLLCVVIGDVGKRIAGAERIVLGPLGEEAVAALYAPDGAAIPSGAHRPARRRPVARALSCPWALRPEHQAPRAARRGPASN